MASVHASEKCYGEWCCIHNPSPHHMVYWPQNWRYDRGIMERICPHGIGHPDPDDPKTIADLWQNIHGCDGCCIDARRNEMVRFGMTKTTTSEITQPEFPLSYSVYGRFLPCTHTHYVGSKPCGCKEYWLDRTEDGLSENPNTSFVSADPDTVDERSHDYDMTVQPHDSYISITLSRESAEALHRYYPAEDRPHEIELDAALRAALGER